MDFAVLSPTFLKDRQQIKADSLDPTGTPRRVYFMYIDSTKAQYSVSLAFGIILPVFPIAIVWGLHMHVKRRLYATIVFTLGSRGPIDAAYKLAIFVQQSEDFASTDPHCIRISCGFAIFQNS
ncbi:hypothetical protein DM02DRAFT_633062 [Periconia macrospinosa]|uniref:Uncharacterized protein n=1 Tax=Periconia macrospinosa TaxID=97972 RepID=A0A2V1DCB6_9PLEO|nr:hypothetical protein DM02DRAFT_633062 [Periconia macrospinosa]